LAATQFEWALTGRFEEPKGTPAKYRDDAVARQMIFSSVVKPHTKKKCLNSPVRRMRRAVYS